MYQDRLKWNKKYQDVKYTDEPAAIVKKYAMLTSGRKALDIAAGNGCNAFFLANQGFAVDAIDIADAGLALFSGKHPDVNPICADFDHFDIPANRYDLIVNIKFLNRRLFPFVVAGLVPGGLLIFQALLQLSPADHTGEHAQYYLRSNELLHAFGTLNILLYRETKDKTNGDTTWLASLVASKPG
jgi:SAM-dependent methyltransferase